METTTTPLQGEQSLSIVFPTIASAATFCISILVRIHGRSFNPAIEGNIQLKWKRELQKGRRQGDKTRLRALNQDLTILCFPPLFSALVKLRPAIFTFAIATRWQSQLASPCIAQPQIATHIHNGAHATRTRDTHKKGTFFSPITTGRTQIICHTNQFL